MEQRKRKTVVTQWEGEDDSQSHEDSERDKPSKIVYKNVLHKYIGRIVHAPTRYKQCGHLNSSVCVEQRMKATSPVLCCKPMAVPLPHSSCVRAKKSSTVTVSQSNVSLIMSYSYVCTMLVVKTAEKHVDYRRKMAHDFGSLGLVRAGVG